MKAKFVKKTYSMGSFGVDVMIVPCMFGTIIQDRGKKNSEFVGNFGSHFSML